MGSKDVVSKDYMRDESIFADVFNFKIYGGRQVVKPQSLTELDTAELVLPYGFDDKSVSIQKFRDVLKLATVMFDENATYVALGIENQSQIHYAMPVRVMLYDAIFYSSQVQAIVRRRRAETFGGKSSDEFLSGLLPGDKIPPVITLVVYFGAEKWTAPRSLYEMLTVSDAETLQFVPDFKLNLIAPYEIADEDFDKLNTDMGLVLKHFKYLNDKIKLDEMFKTNPAYKSLAWETANLLNVMTDSHLNFGERRERVNMANAIQEMRDDAMAIGEARGEAKGLTWLANFVESGVITVEQAARQTGLTEDEFIAKTGLKR